MPFNDRLSSIPISRKLMIVMALVTTTALLAAGVSIFVSDAVLFRTRMQTDLAALAQITADEATAAVAFDDPHSAMEVVEPLRARSHLISACIYRVEGSLLASYVRPGAQLGCVPPGTPPNSALAQGNLIVSRPILLESRRIGTVVLLYDRGELMDRMRRYGTILFLVIFGSSWLSFLVSSRLRDLIARPVEELAKASSAVANTRDYSIRANKLSSDELGTLVDTFNTMLSDIQSRDVELRKTLRELRNSNENLARSNADLERFAFVASHDLQEPLRMMSVYSQLLERKHSEKLNAEATGYLDQIVGGARRMRELLSDLLEYTHVSSAPRIELAMVDLNEVLERSKENLAAAIHASNAVITSDQLPTIPAYEADLVPLFQNLLGNAIKYRDSAAPRVKVSVKDANRFYRFEIADNGIGIAPEYRTKIFLPFQRLHGKEIPGTGIGLAICHRIVQRYEGGIWVEDNPGGGSVFVFTLPKNVAEQQSGKDAGGQSEINSADRGQ